MTRTLVAFGSNIDPDRNVVRAVEALAAAVRIVRIAPVYETPPLDAPGSPPFVNGIIEIDTDLPADALRRNVLHAIEAECGRIRSADPNAPRPIDLDLVPPGEKELADHVAVPLADLFPEHGPVPTPPGFRRRLDLEAALANAGRAARPEV